MILYMPSSLSIKTLNSDDTDYRGNSFFSNRKKEYIKFLDHFIGKKSGMMSRDAYKSLIALSKKIISLKQEIDKLDNEHETIVHSAFYTLIPQELEEENEEKERLLEPIRQKRKEKTTELQQKKGEIKTTIQENLEAKMKNQQSKDVMKKVMDKLYFGDKLKKEYDIRIILVTINYVLYMSNTGRSSALWDNPKGKKAQLEFFKSFEKFFTPEEEDEDNEDEILSNFHESLLYVKEKYGVKLHSDDNEDKQFYKLLLSMNRYPVNTSDIETMWDEINFVEKSTSLQKYLKKPDNIVIQIRGEYTNDNGVKKTQYAFTKRSTLKDLLRSDKKMFYGCKKKEIALIPRKRNVDRSTKYIDNKDVLIGFGKKFWDISIIEEFPNHQLFVLQNLEEDFPSYASVWLANNKLVNGWPERNVISGWHCQHDAPKGTAKLLLGVADSDARPLSRSASIPTPNASPVRSSLSSSSPPPVRRRGRPRATVNSSRPPANAQANTTRRGRPRTQPTPVVAPIPVVAPDEVVAPEEIVAPDEVVAPPRRGRPPANATRRGPGRPRANANTTRRGRPRANPSVSDDDDFMNDILQQTEGQEVDEELLNMIRGMSLQQQEAPVQQDVPTQQEVPTTRVTRGARSLGADCEQNEDCRSGSCVRTNDGTNKCKGNGNNSRVVGDACETDRQCINNNCVDNVCTRRSYTSRGTNGDLGLNRLFSGGKRRATKKNKNKKNNRK